MTPTPALKRYGIGCMNPTLPLRKTLFKDEITDADWQKLRDSPHA